MSTSQTAIVSCPLCGLTIVVISCSLYIKLCISSLYDPSADMIVIILNKLTKYLIN